MFHYRIRNGWTLERALTEPEVHVSEASDHLGNTYPSVRKMCGHYHIGFDTFKARIRKGMTLKDALTAPVRNALHAGFSVKAFAFQDKEGRVYYECSCKECGYSNILTYDEMEEHEAVQHNTL